MWGKQHEKFPKEGRGDKPFKGFPQNGFSSTASLDAGRPLLLKREPNGTGPGHLAVSLGNAHVVKGKGRPAGARPD